MKIILYGNGDKNEYLNVQNDEIIILNKFISFGMDSLITLTKGVK